MADVCVRIGESISFCFAFYLMLLFGSLFYNLVSMHAWGGRLFVVAVAVLFFHSSYKLCAMRYNKYR